MSLQNAMIQHGLGEWDLGRGSILSLGRKIIFSVEMGLIL